MIRISYDELGQSLFNEVLDVVRLIRKDCEVHELDKGCLVFRKGKDQYNIIPELFANASNKLYLKIIDPDGRVEIAELTSNNPILWIVELEKILKRFNL